MAKLNKNKELILSLMFGGAALCLTRSPKQYFKILKLMGKEWGKLKKEKIKYEIKQLYKSKFISMKQTDKKDEFIIQLSDKGKRYILKYNIYNMKIKKHEWDGKWRVIMFDIPEAQKAARDSLRSRFKKLELHELQKSVFVYPYECQQEINFITEFYQVRPFVRYGLLEYIDNELHLKNIFQI